MTTEDIERNIQEIWSLFKETDKKIKETDRILEERFKETDRILKEQFKETDRMFKETDRMFKETDRMFKETDKKIERMASSVETLKDKWGRFVEGLIIPFVETLFSSWSMEITEVHQRAKTRRNGKTMEVDILGVNKEYVVLIEAKSTLSKEDVDEHLERLMNFKQFFPAYHDKKVVGAVAGIVINEGIDRYAYRNGLFVLTQSGELIKVLNDSKFKPRVW